MQAVLGTSVGIDGCPGNLIVQGDNLHALKTLLPRYAGQVKCIYIDPPYTPARKAKTCPATTSGCA